jgi:Sulfatase
MLRIIQKYPLYLFLLPIFFVLHGYVENFGFVELKEAGLLLLSYIFLALSISGFSYVFFRNWNRAALITVFWMSFFFFFGALHDFLKQHSPIEFITRYSFLLSSALIILFFLFIFFKKSTKPFQRFSIYLNLLFIIYIVVDIGTGVWKANSNDTTMLSVYGAATANNYVKCDTCQKPDIYFLLYDEYGGSASLKAQYGYENDLDSFLVQKGFSIQKNSRSNYSFTPFSMSSILNMSYINGIKNPKAVSADDYANCNLLIRDNEVIKFLDVQGYEIINYSVFDLAGNPSRVDQSFLPLKTKLISDRTLFAHMNKDIGWLLITRFPFNLFSSNHFLKHKLNNEKFQQLTMDEASRKSAKPKFIYSHFYMPHPPYFYDKNGKLKDQAVIYHEYKVNPPASYLEYVTYCNTKVRELINAIQSNNPNAVILLMSDHGYREAKSYKTNYFFQNLNAAYFPDHKYDKFYDSVSGVNEFRIVLNKYFMADFPLLPDSTVLLVDKK